VKPNRLTVAILDDEEPVRRALKRLMVSAGFEVEAFACAADFLASLSLRRPDCLVLDLHMPGVNGFDVQARLARSPNPPPVVVITGHDTPETQYKALNGGAAAYLRKPVDDQVLLDAVAAAARGERPGAG
jgi:FixJ family two-component response regulator